MDRRILKYQTGIIVGEGSYGTVYKAQDTETGKCLALKKIKVNANGTGIPSSSLREVSILKYLQHKNIIRTFDTIHTKNSLILVMEYVEMDLSKYIKTHPDGISKHILKSFLHQLLEGVNYCHEKKVLHRDIKPQNILINNELELKIADFGLARCFKYLNGNDFSNEVVTLWYRAPDILMGSRNYTTSIDLWSVGCIFAELLLGKPLFRGKDYQSQINAIFSTLGTPSVQSWPEFQTLKKETTLRVYEKPGKSFEDIFEGLEKEGLDLVAKLLECNPSKRINCEDALQHPYFTV